MTESTSPDLRLRPIEQTDRTFVQAVFVATRGDAFRQAGLPDTVIGPLLEQQFAAQQSQYRAQFAGADFDLVLADGAPVGYLYAQRGPERFVLVDVALLPAQCGRGIGTRLVNGLIAQAESAGQSLHAHVAKEGRAWALWRRLGFEAVGDDGVYLAIERRPCG